MQMTEAISIIVAVAGMLIGLAGFLANRDKKIAGDAEWRGSVNTKLDTIHQDIGGVSDNIKAMQIMITSHGERITAVEESTASAHKRLDGLGKNNK
jgi:wobble nucleotide-excising tRNase